MAERNLGGRGQYAKASVSYGQNTRGFGLSFVEPYLLGYRMAGGIDLYARQNLATSYVSYDTKTIGVNLRLGFQLTEELSLQPHYSIYRQEISLPYQYNDCVDSAAAVAYRAGTGPGVQPGDSCYSNGEASLAVRSELAQGPVVVSLVGYTLAYNTLDDNRSPTEGIYAKLTEDLAGVGGDVNFIRSTAEVRKYAEVMPDVVGVLKLQGGHIASWGGQQLRMLDHFFMGSNLVRGFETAGIGPRDITPGTNQDALGGSMYWGASLEFQTPLYFLPKEIGIKLATFADAGSLWDYKGPTSWNQTGETVNVADSAAVRSSVGMGLIWDSPLGPLRIDVAYPLTKESYDRTQLFRFSGGTKF